MKLAYIFLLLLKYLQKSDFSLKYDLLSYHLFGTNLLITHYAMFMRDNVIKFFIGEVFCLINSRKVSFTATRERSRKTRFPNVEPYFVSNWSFASHIKPHKGVRHQMKCDVINENIPSQIFYVIQSDVALQKKVH